MSTTARTDASAAITEGGASETLELVSLLEREAREELDGRRAAALLSRAAAAARTIPDDGRAEALLLRSLALLPGDPALLRELARVREDAGDLAGVAAVLEEEADRTSGPAEAATRYLALARWWEERLGRRDRAALFYGRAARLAPGLAEARRRAVACAEALGRHRHAKQILDSWRDAGGDRAELAGAYARLGSLLADEPLEHGLALEALLEAMLLDRSTPGAAETLERLRAAPRTWRDQALALERRAAVERDRREAARIWLRLAGLHAAYDPDGAAPAQEAFDRAWLAAPGNSRALDLLELWHGERGDWPGLREELSRLARGSRDLVAAVAVHLRLAQLLLVRFGDAAGAEEALARAFELDPANDEAALHLFEAHVDAGRAAEALTVLERHLDASRQRPEHAPLRLRAAALALSAGDPARARRMLEAALREDPSNGEASRALVPLLEEAGEWGALADRLEAAAEAERDPSARATLLLRAGEVALDALADAPRALRLLSWALATEPARLATRRLLEAAAMRAGDPGELSRAFRAGAGAAAGDPRTRKELLRRVAEIEEHDLGRADEAARVWRAIADLDPGDAEALAAWEESLARAGRHAEILADLEARHAAAEGAVRRELGMRLARLRLEAGDVAGSAAAWRDLLAADGTDAEALRGIATALRAQGGEEAAVELCAALARLAAQGASDRVELEIERAGLLLEPLGRPEESAGAWLALLEGGGLAPPQLAQVTRALESLLSAGVERLRIARALAPVHASAGEPARLVEMLEVIAGDPSASPGERARTWLDASAVREDRLGDVRGALDAAAEALRVSPAHPEARRRVEALAGRTRAHAELFGLLSAAADALAGIAGEELPLRIRAAQVAEEELGSQEQAVGQLRRAREIAPGDPEPVAALTRLALAGERWAEARELLEDRERLAATPAERVALLTQLGDLLRERLGDPATASGTYRAALALVPPEQSTRLLVRLAHALADAGEREPLAAVLAELSARPDLPPGVDLPPLPPPVDPVERLEEARRRLVLDPHDVAAAAEMEQLAVDLDRPADLAWVLEQRLAAALFDASIAFRIAELRRLRLGDPDGALRMLVEVLAHDPDHDGARQALVDLARRPGPAGRAALLQLDFLPARPGDVEVRLAAREDRLAAEHDPSERAHLQGEIRTLLEVDLDDPVRALEAARGAFAAGGQEREEALADIPRLAGKCGRPDVLADVYEAAAEGSTGAAALGLLRMAARTRDRMGDDEARLAAWRRVAAAVPDDVEALEAQDRILSAARRVDELGPVLLALADARRGDPARRLEVLLRRAVLLEGSGDPRAAVEAHAAVLEEYPHEGAALAGLARALARPGSRAAAAELLERTHRAAGDLEQLADVLEVRVDDLPLPEREGALDELARLRESTGNAAGAFEARARTYDLVRDRPDAEAAVRADLCRLAGAARAADRLAAILSRSLEAGLPQGAEGEVLSTLAGLHRDAGRWGELADVLRRLAERDGDPAARRDAWLELAEVAGERLDRAGQAHEAWSAAAALLDREADEAAQAGDGPAAASTWLRAAAIRRERLGDPRSAAASLRAASRADPGGAAVREAALALAEDEGALDAEPEFLAGVLGEALDRAAVDGDLPRAQSLRLRLAALREDRLGDPEAALELLAAVLAADPGNDAALARVERARERSPARAEAVLERAYTASGRHASLAAILEAMLPRLGAGGGDVAMRLGALHEGPLDRPEAAPRFYEEARRLDPALATRALPALERLYRRLERWEDLAGALEGLAAAESRPEERTGLLFVLAQLCEERLDSPARAADAWLRILDADPAHPATLRALSRIAATAAEGDPALAARIWARLAERDPTDRGVLESLRRAQEALGDHAGLAATLRTLLVLEPGAAREHRLALAEALLRSGGDPSAAVEQAREAVPLASAGVGELARLEALYRAAGAEDDALRVAEARAGRMEDGPSAAAAWRDVAAAWSSRGRTAEAAAALGEAYTRDPASPETFAALRGLHAAAGDWGAWARVTETRIARAAAEEGAALLEELAGTLESRAGDATGALRAWSRVLELDPGSETALAALERLSSPGGEPEALVAALERAAGAASGARRAGLLLRVAVARGVRQGDARAGARAVSEALREVPSCLDALPAEGEPGEPAVRAALLAWGARAATAEGDVRRALSFLEEAHRLAPGDGDVGSALESAVRHAGDPERLAALLASRSAAEADPAARARLLVERGELLAGPLGRRGEAEAAFREALALGLPPEEAAALHLRLAAWGAEDGRGGASVREDYERALALSPACVPAIQALQVLRKEAGDRAGYVEMLVAEARLVEDPRRAADALVEAGRLGQLGGATAEESVRLYEEALARAPDHRPAALALSDVLEARGDFAGLARLLGGLSARLGDADPRERLRHLCRLAAAREHTGDLDGALAAWREAHAIDPTSLPALKGLGALLVRRDAWDEALPVLQNVLAHHRDALSPAEVAVTCGWVGQMLERTGWTEQAAETYEKALEANPVHVASLRGMARILQARGDWPRAAGVLETLLRMPEVLADRAGAARLHVELGELLRDRVGDEELALQHLEQGLDLDPRQVKAFAAIEASLAAKRRWRDLARAIERMIARLPDAPDTARARTALWKELGALQHRALGDRQAARDAYRRVVDAAPDDLEALEAFGELSAAIPGEEAVAAEAFRTVARRQADPARAVSRLLAVQLARKELDRAYAAADVLVHLLRRGSPAEVETADRLARLSREFATRTLDDVLWQRLLHERLRSGPVVGILSLLARDAGSLFVQSPKDLGLRADRDEVDLATSGLVLANGIKYAARSLGIEQVRLFRVAGSPMRLGFANTDPPSLVAGEETYQDRPRRELWYVTARAVSFYRPEMRLARLMPHDQLQAVFHAACSLGAPGFPAQVEPRSLSRMKAAIEKALSDKGRLGLLARLAAEYMPVARPGDVRAHMDAVELTANRAGALLAGDLRVARKLVLEEKAQVSKLQEETRIRDLVQFCLSEDWAALRDALGLSVAAR